MAVQGNGTLAARLLEELERDPRLAVQLASKLGLLVVSREDFAALVAEVRNLAEAVREQGQRIEEQGRRIEEAFRHVDALGARWGFKSEAAFRNGLREVLARRFSATVERWQHEDAAGEVFGIPSSVELDVVVRDGEPLLIEVKAHVGIADIGAFRRKADLYDRLHGTRSARLVVSPAVDERAAESAARAGIGISTDLT